MNQIKVQFNTPEEVVKFTNLVSQYDYDMDVKRSSKRIADAKSLLGILALGLENRLELCIYADEDCSEMVNAIQNYVVA